MKTERMLKRWREAGLLTAQQSQAIQDYEREHVSASWILYGLTGLGISVLLIGVISIFAANWHAIPASAKLVLYFLSLAALGFATWWRLAVTGALKESLITAFGLYVLAGIGLIGQTYHLESDGYSALFLWLALILPISLCTESRLLNNIWFVGLIVAVSLWVGHVANENNFGPYLFFVLALPHLVIACGYLLHSQSPYFAEAARVWGFAVLLIPFAIYGNVVWGSVESLSLDLSADSLSGWWRHAPIAAAACAGVCAIKRPFRQGWLLTAAILSILFFSLLLTVAPITIKLTGSHPLLGCSLFILAWAGAAALAAGMERRRLFDLAAFVIGVRFVVVYFEVFGSLAATGLGLILSGGVILGISYLWFTYRGRVQKALMGAVR